MPENPLFSGDNLDVLRQHIKDESVDDDTTKRCGLAPPRLDVRVSAKPAFRVAPLLWGNLVVCWPQRREVAIP
jgi:hypothetical protein